jgi:cytochrome c oxidase cbb3-type subunit 3
MRLTMLVLAACWTSGAACDRRAEGTERRSVETGMTKTAAPSPSGGVTPGIVPQKVLGDVHNPHAGDAAAAATGRQLFVGFNCAGCHGGYGGGGMGPSLRDSLWIYGSSDAQIFSSIAEGRAYGMPAWGGHIPEDLIWQLVTYINTLETSNEPLKPPKPRA